MAADTLDNAVCHSSRKPAIRGARAIVSEKVAYDRSLPLSDHLPQVYDVSFGVGSNYSSTSQAHGGTGSPLPHGENPQAVVEVLVCNVMCRGRAGCTGRPGTALAGQVLTNNGLECDESVEAYENRMLERISRAIAQRWTSPTREDADGADAGRSFRIACLQELPPMPLLQEELLEAIRLDAGRPQLQIAVQPSSGGDKGDGLPFATCTGIMWDAAEIANVGLLPASSETTAAGALCMQTASIGGALLGFCSVHFPFVDRHGGVRYQDAVSSARQRIGLVASCAASAGVEIVLIAGDFNVDIRDVFACDHPVHCKQRHLALGVVADSSTFKGERLTTDGCLILELQPETAEQASAPQVFEKTNAFDEPVWRVGGSAPFFGKKGRDDFLESLVARTLQDDPRVWRLGDKALASLGLWPFADQPRVLGRLLASSADGVGPSKKKPKLSNPLGLAETYDSDEETSSSSESGG